MVSSRGSTSRTCPACGAHNSDLSLFCAECGTGLNGGTWQQDDQTEAFQPASTSTSSRWDNLPPSNHPRTAEAANSDTNETPYIGPSAPPYAHGDSAVADSWSNWRQSEDRGARGFVLGTLAWILILAVFGLFLWVYVLSGELKDDIRNLLPGLSAILIWI